MMIQKDRRYVVEQLLLPEKLYSSGPLLLANVLKGVNPFMERLYIEANANYPGPLFKETHRIYVRDDISILVIRIEMPTPSSALLSRAVYLCYCSKNGEDLYFTSELSSSGEYFLCCRPDGGRIKHLRCCDAPKDTAKEFDLVADHYWELVINDGLEQLESLCAS